MIVRKRKMTDKRNWIRVFFYTNGFFCRVKWVKDFLGVKEKLTKHAFCKLKKERDIQIKTEKK